MMLVFAVLLPVLMGSVATDEFKPVDCSQINTKGQTVSGIYSIYPAGNIPVWVYCDMVTTGADDDKGGWTVFQRRMDGIINFYLPWNEYKRGFGATEGEYWLGLETMYQLTRNRKYMLRVDMEDFTGSKGYALYSSFSVDSEADGYRLHVSGFKDGGAGDSLTYHDGQKFTTFDKDQDAFGKNCAKEYLGAFWYTSCHYANPNGVYTRGEDDNHVAIANAWYHWKNNYVGLKSISMKIRSVS
ncbi:microfibril-associated glycoprotein 4-like [Xyrauchen texanus]|uniref:microfibril-associated glycoprotein 4-like n=1 Tax=Xyrauchen texanus TaxID=154827 RepID=UPI0022427FDB|nr:microfibril-associated glycoprotein 4-like [Xyrauchen texanus]